MKNYFVTRDWSQSNLIAAVENRLEQNKTFLISNILQNPYEDVLCHKFVHTRARAKTHVHVLIFIPSRHTMLNQRRSNVLKLIKRLGR